MRFVLYTIGGLFAIVAIGIALITLFVPTDWAVEQLKQQVRAQTGRELKIDGGASLSFYPSLGVSVSGVSLSGPAGDDNAPMLTAREIEVAMPVVPLLSRELEIDTFRLVDPVINLTVDENGASNFDFDTSHPGRDARTDDADFENPVLRDFARNRTEADAVDAPAASRRSDDATAIAANEASADGIDNPLSSLSGLTLQNVVIANGTVRYDNRQPGQRINIDELNVLVSMATRDAPLLMTGEAIWNGQKVPVSAQVRSLVGLLDADPTPVAFEVDAALMRLAYEGEVTLDRLVSLEGRLSAESPDMGRTVDWLTGQALRADLDRLALNGTIALRDGNRISMPDLQMAALGTTLSGDLQIDASRGLPSVRGRLSSPELNVDELQRRLDTLGGAGSPDASSARADAGNGGRPRSDDDDRSRARNGDNNNRDGRDAPWDDTPIDASALRAADVSLDLRLDRLTVSGLTLGPVVVLPEVRGGIATINLERAALYNGEARGIITADGTGRRLTVTADLALNGLTARPFLNDLAQFDRLSGTADGALRITSKGRSVKDLVGALDGTGRFSFADGQVIGINIAKVLRNASNFQFTGLDGGADEATDFTALSGSVVINRGIIRNDDLEMVSPLLAVTGEGEVRLPEKRIDYLARPELVDTLVGQGRQNEAQGAGLPVRIRGPLSDPSIGLDSSELFKDPETAVRQIEDLTRKVTGGDNKAIKEGLDALKKSTGLDSFLRSFGGGQ